MAVVARTEADRHLDALGADPARLDPAVVCNLAERGYHVFPDLADPELCAALGARIDELVAAEGAQAAREHHQETGCHRLANLVDKGGLFDAVWLQPDVLAAMRVHFARPFKLSSLNAREALRGGGHQPLHQDWKRSRTEEPGVHVMNALWAIDRLDPDNGSPRLVPGSHRLAELPATLLADPHAPHPDEILALLPAGSVMLIDAHCWHGGTENRSGTRRRIVHSYFTAREHPQQQDQRRWLTPATVARLTPAARWLADVA